MAKKEEAIVQDKLDRVSRFLSERKEIYLQEHRDANTEVEKFVWSEMVNLLDEIDRLLEAE